MDYVLKYVAHSNTINIYNEYVFQAKSEGTKKWSLSIAFPLNLSRTISYINFLFLLL